MSLLNELKASKIIAIARGLDPERGLGTAQALEDGGIRFVEVTTNSEGAYDTVRAWRERFDGRLRVGVGTVLDLGMAKEAVKAGAEYIVSPNVDEQVIYYAREQGIDVFPGAMTPTEIVKAWTAGATAVKLFPMASLGLGYLKEVRAPLDRIPIVATGGVRLDNIADFLAAGVIAVGLGSNLLDKQMIAEGRFAELTELARRYADAAAAFGGAAQ